jgi:GNAT superfamily N-acetyltransferase
MRERLDPLYEDDSRAWSLLAEAGDELVGVASLSMVTGADARTPPEGTIYLWQMFARPGWHGTGLAGAMLDRLLEEARRRGKTRVTLWAAEGAAQARRFYEREGFTLTGERDENSFFGLPIVQYGREVI